MAPHSRRRTQIWLLWAGFLVAAAAAAFAIHRLYDTARSEIAAQQRRAIEEQRALAVARIREEIEVVRLATIRELAGIHVDGLAPSLRRWDDANATILATFLWEPSRGFITRPAAAMASAPGEESLVAAWTAFRSWRSSHPDDSHCELANLRDQRLLAIRTVDDARLSSTDLGYQSENLEMLAYEGRTVDPWAAWLASTVDSTACWVVWYQPGPDAPVRGCFIDAAPVIAGLRASWSDSRLAHLSLVPAAEATSDDTMITPLLPSLVLRAEPGALFAEKQAAARLAFVAIVLLFGIFLLAAIVLAAYSRREARDAERKTTFVSQVSHELRTPLTSIRMFADMLASPAIAEEKRLKFADTISRESRRLGELIERLLTFNSLERGRLSIAIEPLDVAAVVRETLDEMDAALRASGLHTESVLPDHAVIACSDRNALKQALINLLDNAIKYAATGGILKVTLRADPTEINLTVADHGPGIPRDLRRSVFEPFVQGGRTLTDKSPGVGLGLSIARGLLRQAGGDLLLIPSDVGAVFKIRLPVTTPA